ncbi:MAG: single-stranded DNA-binding protein [Acidobacteria bacterium]|nr:MAG: single-stranded DNA-binding protein [Acidobacteriota bacterium]
MYNKVTLIGRAGTDAEVRYTQNQSKIVKFSMATNRYWNDRSGVRQEKTEWHNIVCWGYLADRAEKMVTKGSLIMVEGAIEYSNWQDNEGIKHYRTDIRAQTLLMLSAKRSGGAPGPQPGPVDSASAPEPTSRPEPTSTDFVDDIEVPKSDLDDDIPF